jgi:nitrate reductase gamma subunit
MSLIDFIEGPLWIFSAWFFVIFVAWRLANILLTGRGLPHNQARPRGSPTLGALRTNLEHFAPRAPFMARAKVWLVTIAGYAFHLGLFALLFFAAPHVAFIEEHILGVGWPPMSRTAFIISAQVAFAGLMVLWIRRFLDPVVRLISRPDDHIAAGLTFIVMLTGCMALGEQSETLRVLHLFTVEAWLIYFPFSSLMHTFTWPLSRGASGALAGRRGARM